MKSSNLIIIGIILVFLSLIIGGLGAIVSFQPLTGNTFQEEAQTVTNSSNFSIEKGRYEIWIEDSSENRKKWDDIDIHVYDEHGENIKIERRKGKIVQNGADYSQYGSFHIPEDGNYSFGTSENITFLVTDPIGVEEEFLKFCMVGSLTILGLIVGVLMILASILRSFMSSSDLEEKGSTGWDWKWLFFSLEGRIGRKRFILGSLLLLGVKISYWIIAIMVLILLGAASAWNDIAGMMWIQIYLSLLLLSLVFLWPHTALVVKRLKDLNMEPLLVIPYILLRDINLIFWIILAIKKGKKPKKKKRKGLEISSKEEEPVGKGYVGILFRFGGRLERKEYILGTVLILSLTFMNWIGGLILMIMIGHWVAILLILISMVFIQLLLTWPDAALGVKRLRDMGYEPLLIIVLIVLPWIPLIGGVFSLIMRIWMMAKKGKRYSSGERTQAIDISETMRLVILGIFVGVFCMLMTISGIEILLGDTGDWGYGSILILLGILSSLGLIIYIRKTINNLRQGFPRQDEYSKILIKKSATRAFFIFIIMQIILMLFVDLIDSTQFSELVLFQVILMLVIFGLSYLWSYYLDDPEDGG